MWDRVTSVGEVSSQPVEVGGGGGPHDLCLDGEQGQGQWKTQGRLSEASKRGWDLGREWGFQGNL